MSIDTRASTLSLEDLPGRTPEELFDIIQLAKAHLRELHQDEHGGIRELDDAEQRAFDQLLAVHDKAEKMLEEHRSIAAVFQRRPERVRHAISSLGGGDSEQYPNVRLMRNEEARERALRMLDNREATAHLKPDQKDKVERDIRRDPDLAKRLIVTESPDYRTAWQKLVTQPHPVLTDEERNAVLAWDEYRAANEGSPGAAGGYGVPVFIDPSIILTAQGSSNPFLAICRQVNVTTNAWKGVSSAGVSWAFGPEASTVTDNAPTLAQPAIPIFTARGFIPYSIEIGMDYPDFAGEMATLLASGYDELLVQKFTSGAGGTTEPQGILTALSANPNVRVALTTGGSLGAPDPYNVWKALPQRYRRNAAWLMSVGVNNAIRNLGTANVYHAVTATLPEAWADALFGRAVYESPYMPDVTTGTAATDGMAVVGDFSNYVIARRAGMAVELVPQIFDVTFNRPTGQRGWFAWARIGSGSVNDIGFRLLVNH